jgi:hypothetical protein
MHPSSKYFYIHAFERNTKMRICPEKRVCENTNLPAKYSLKIRNMHLIPEVWTLRGGEQGDFHSAVVFSFNSCTIEYSYLILQLFIHAKALSTFLP